MPESKKKKPVLTDPLDQELGFRVFRTGMAHTPLQVEYANGRRRPASDEEFYLYTLLRRIYDAAPEEDPSEVGLETADLVNGHGEVLRTLEVETEGPEKS